MSHSSYLDYISQFFSDPKEFEHFSESIKNPLPRSFTLIQSRNKADSTLTQIKTQWFDATPSDYNPFNYRLNNKEIEQSELIQNLPLGKTPEHILWYFYIQETAASLPATIADIPMTWNILDMCAAPGWKTTQLADRAKVLWSQALVRGNDPDSKRLMSLGSNINRAWMENVVITNLDGTSFGNLMPDFFDTILLDAPCGWEGTGFKSDFWTKFWDIRKVEAIARVQQQLLISAVKTCKIWGQIVYSTCTINPVENEMNVARILEKYGDILELEDIQINWLSNWLDVSKLNNESKWDLHKNTNTNQSTWALIETKVKRLWPHTHHTWWFFLCKLRKKWSVELNPINTQKYNQKAELKKWMYSKFTVCKQSEVREWLNKEFGIEVPKHIVFLSSKNQIYASYDQIIPYLTEYKIDRPGLLVIKWDKPSNRRVTHGSGLLFDFGKEFQYELNDKQVMQHVNMQDIDIEDDWWINRYAQLMRKWTKVGVGKIVGNNIKNKLTGVL